MTIDEFDEQVRALDRASDTIEHPSMRVVQLLLITIRVCIKAPELAQRLDLVTQPARRVRVATP